MENSDSVLRVNSDNDCQTSFDGPQGRLSVSVELHRTADGIMDLSPHVVQQFYVRQRDHASSPPTDIDGVGAEAFWWADDDWYQIHLETYDGNINATLWVFAVGGDHMLAQDMPDRLAAVGASIFTGLEAY